LPSSATETPESITAYAARANGAKLSFAFVVFGE